MQLASGSRGRGQSMGRGGASVLGRAEQRRGRGKRVEEEDEADGGPAWSVSASVRDERGWARSRAGARAGCRPSGVRRCWAACLREWSGPCGWERERRRPWPVWAADFQGLVGLGLGFFSNSNPNSSYKNSNKFEFKL